MLCFWSPRPAGGSGGAAASRKQGVSIEIVKASASFLIAWCLTVLKSRCLDSRIRFIWVLFVICRLEDGFFGFYHFFSSFHSPAFTIVFIVMVLFSMVYRVKHCREPSDFQRKLDSIRVCAVKLAHQVNIHRVTPAARKSGFNQLLLRTYKLLANNKDERYKKSCFIEELKNFLRSPKECRAGLRFCCYQIESPDLFIPVADEVGVFVRKDYREEVGILSEN